MHFNKLLYIISLTLLIGLIGCRIVVGGQVAEATPSEQQTLTPVLGLQPTPLQYNIINDPQWEAFIQALIWMESRGDQWAKNPRSSALGQFQQLKVYVDEANRIVGYRKYSYDDRTDPLLARQMFDIVQGYWNPSKDINRAIRLHAGLWDEQYVRGLKSKMRYLLT